MNAITLISYIEPQERVVHDTTPFFSKYSVLFWFLNIDNARSTLLESRSVYGPPVVTISLSSLCLQANVWIVP